MRATSAPWTATVVLASLGAAACAPSVGVRGAPCDADGRCDTGLACILDTCAGEGDVAAAIPLGFLAPTSGAFSDYGQGQLDAMRMALDDVNQAGGVLGRHFLRSFLVDTSGVPQTASQAARALAQVEGVVAFVGPGTTPEALAVAAVAAQRRLPLVSPSAGSNLLSDDRLASAPFFFRTGPSDDERGAALAGLADDQGCGDALIFRRDDPYGAILADGFLAARPGADERVYPAALDDDEQWPQVAAAAVAEAAADIAGARAPLCVVLGSYPQDGGAIAAALLPLLAEDALLLAPDLLADPLFTDALGDDAARVRGVVPAPGDDDAAGAFAAAFEARTGAPPPPSAAAAYDAVALTALALEAAQSTTGALVAAELVAASTGGARVVGGGDMEAPLDAARARDDLDYAGPSGEVDLDAAGEAHPPLTTWRIVDGEVVVAPLAATP